MLVGKALMNTIVLGIFWVLRVVEFFVVLWVILSWVVFFTARSSFRWGRAFEIVPLREAILFRFVTAASTPDFGVESQRPIRPSLRSIQGSSCVRPA